MGVGAILGNECGIQEQNYVTLLVGSKMIAGFTTGIGFYVYNVLG